MATAAPGTLRNNIRRQVEDKLAMLLVERGEGSVSGVSLSAREGALQLDVM